MPFVILPTNSASGGYNITNSLRFNSGSSDYLSRTPSSTGDRQKFTISCWVKRSTLTASGKNIMVAWSGAKSGASFGSAIYFNSSDQIEVDHDIAGSDYTFNTNMVFRDTSAWYHIVFAVDTTQATSSNRQTIYVNGSSVTLATSALGFPVQNFNTYFNFSGGENDIGSDYFSAGYADQYMSEFYLIDGQALTPTSFGETDEDTGIWKPKAYTGTYGTNGFYLQFKNSASLGTDSSGNGNTFTVNNLTSIDQTTDTPTNNFSTMNPLSIIGGDPTLSEGNLKTTTTTAGWRSSVGTFGLNTGKWYWEMKIGTISASNYNMIGIISDNLISSLSTTYIGSGTYAYTMNHDGQKYVNNTNSSFGSSLATGNIVMCAMDLTNNYFYLGINGTWQNSGVPTSGSSGTGALSAIQTGYYYFPAVSVYNSTNEINFGSPNYSSNSYTDGAGYGNFSYAVPSGYYSLNTRNLANFG